MPRSKRPECGNQAGAQRDTNFGRDTTEAEWSRSIFNSRRKMRLLERYPRRRSVDVTKQVWSWTPESDLSNKTKSTSTESPAVKMVSNHILVKYQPSNRGTTNQQTRSTDPLGSGELHGSIYTQLEHVNSTIMRDSLGQNTIILEGYIPGRSRQRQGIHKQRSNIYLLRFKETNRLSSRRIAPWPWGSFVTR